MPELTMEDYMRHSSFYLREEFDTYYVVTMKAATDAFYNYITLEGVITPHSHYQIPFAKPTPYNNEGNITLEIA